MKKMHQGRRRTPLLKGMPKAKVGMQIGAATMENIMEVPQKKIKNRNTIWFSSSASGYLSEENKNTNSKRYPTFTAALFTISQDMETTWVSISRWMYKKCEIIIYNIYYNIILS